MLLSPFPPPFNSNCMAQRLWTTLLHILHMWVGGRRPLLHPAILQGPAHWFAFNFVLPLCSPAESGGAPPYLVTILLPIGGVLLDDDGVSFGAFLLEDKKEILLAGVWGSCCLWVWSVFCFLFFDGLWLLVVTWFFFDEFWLLVDAGAVSFPPSGVAGACCCLVWSVFCFFDFFWQLMVFRPLPLHHLMNFCHCPIQVD